MTDNTTAFRKLPVALAIARTAFVASAESTSQQLGYFPQSGSPGLDERRP